VKLSVLYIFISNFLQFKRFTVIYYDICSLKALKVHNNVGIGKSGNISIHLLYCVFPECISCQLNILGKGN